MQGAEWFFPHKLFLAEPMLNIFCRDLFSNKPPPPSILLYALLPAAYSSASDIYTGDLDKENRTSNEHVG